MQLTVIKSLTF